MIIHSEPERYNRRIPEKTRKAKSYAQSIPLSINADIVLPQRRGLDRVNDTDFMTIINKVTDRVVTVVGRRLKTDDAAVIRKGIQMRRQQLEAISVICEFERLEEYFAI